MEKQTLRETVRRAGGPNEARTWLAKSGVDLFAKVSESTLFRWLSQEQEDAHKLPENATLAQELLQTAADLPETAQLDDERIKILPEQVIRYLIVPHPASLPLALIEPLARTLKGGTGLHGAEDTTRLALGLRIQRVRVPSITTVGALKAISRARERLADCTIAPDRTGNKIYKKSGRKMVRVCRVACVPNMVLRRQKGPPVADQKVKIIYEDLPNTEYWAKASSAWHPEGTLFEKNDGIDVGDWEAAADIFKRDKSADQIFLFSSTTLQRRVREALGPRSDVTYESNDEFTGVTDWYLWLNRRCFTWPIVRTLLKALKISAAKVGEISPERFESETDLPATQMEILERKLFSCDRLRAEITELW